MSNVGVCPQCGRNEALHEFSWPEVKGVKSFICISCKQFNNDSLQKNEQAEQILQLKRELEIASIMHVDNERYKWEQIGFGSLDELIEHFLQAKKEVQQFKSVIKSEVANLIAAGIKANYGKESVNDALAKYWVPVVALQEELGDYAHKDKRVLNRFALQDELTEVLKDVFKEIDYQNNKWGEQHNRKQTVEGHLLILEEELLEARKGWAKNLTGRNSVQSEITQVVAVGIQALININARQQASTGTWLKDSNVYCNKKGGAA